MPDPHDDQHDNLDTSDSPRSQLRDNKRAGNGNGANGGGSGGGGGGDGNMRFSRSMLGWILILSIALLLFILLHNGAAGPTVMSYDQFTEHLDQGDVKTITVRDDSNTYTFLVSLREGVPNQPLSTNGEPPKYLVYYPATALDGYGWNALVQQARNAQKGHAGTVAPSVEFKPSSNFIVNFLMNTVPWLALFLIIWFLFLRQMRASGGGIGMLGNFGRSRHRLLSKEHTNITFADVAGIEEAKEELTEIVEFLKNPKRFQKLGGRIPRGVLLVGDPGVGKTLLAKAIAGEADVPFYSISGSDFVEMFVGVGASRVRDLFKTAKESSPCIIFLDEIDAVGRRRGNGMASGGHDEREQTLNAILVEMDGFDTNDQVIVIASTNRADVLDPALTRPGRFDRQVYVPLPDIKGRYEILKVHSRKVKLAGSVDLMRLARQTPMFSGADLAAIINEAAIIATMANKEAIEMGDLEEARDKLRFGKARKSRVIDEKEKAILAWHEAGHAIVQALQTDYDPLHKVSIIGRGRMGGAAFSIPEKDRIVYSKRYMQALLRICYGGRLAEELYVGDMSTGASQDIHQASNVARAMVTEYGMSETLGPIKFSPDENRQSFFGEQKDYSDKTAEQIDQEVHRLISTAYEEAKQILIEKKEALTALKDALLKYETLDAEDVKRILAGQTISKPTVTDILASEQQRRAEARREEEKRTPTPEGPTTGPIPQPG
ncbi:MAG TPA: ATP-dependent zinc metalloprotease FtsH [Phycisphaerae bacterium]|nr:ATP-dependent zinc metalloprotease FtsH [Phycisphaerae bacterium]